jgi:hypothetical protein
MVEADRPLTREPGLSCVFEGAGFSTEQILQKSKITRGSMKRFISLLAVLLLISVSVFAAGAKTYQVSGPVLDIKGDVITVQKGTEKWEITLDKSAKVTGDLKVGSKVTIEYRMTATSVEVKPATEKPAAAKKK